MRIKRDTPFFERPSAPRKILKKTFLVFEGEKTEANYFRDLVAKRNRQAAVIFLESPSSNPSIIASHLAESIQDEKLVEVTPSFVLEAFLSYSPGNARDEKRTRNKLQDWLRKNGMTKDEVIEDESLFEIVSFLEECSPRGVDIKLYAEYIKGQCEYLPEYDSIYLVVDRDRRSFTKSQYDMVVKESRENDVQLIVTNPCIEFFYLLHHCPWTEYDETDLLANKKTGKNTFVYRKLREHDPKYGKKIRDFDFYIRNYEVAKANATGLTQEVEKLKTRLGTNIFVLIDALLAINKNES